MLTRYLTFLTIFTLMSVSQAVLAKKKKTRVVLSVGKVEVVPSKLKEIEVAVVHKDVHGKQSIRTEKKIVSKKINFKKNKLALSYFKSVTNLIKKNSSPYNLKKKEKGNGLVKCKIQIQENGRYDILDLSSDNRLLMKLADATLQKIKRFPPIPSKLGQLEIQLKIPLTYKLSK